MPRKPGTESALSEVVSITLIILLLVVIALVVYVVFIGQAHIAPKSAYISARGMNVNLSLGSGSYANTIGLFHFEGDAVNLNRSKKGDGMAPVGFNILTPSGEMETVRASSLISDNTWNSGDIITIYEDASGYWVTDNITRRIDGAGTLGPLVDMPGGNYTVNVVDLKADVLVAAIPVIITGSGTTIQYSPGLIAYYYTGQTWTTLAATTIAPRVYYADIASGRASDISNWPVGLINRAENFSVKYDGYFKADTEADYTFTLSSDDGSWMDFDGTSNFISNGGLHSYAPVSATRHLKPGYYPITIRMYENTGQAVVYLTYTTPSTTSQVVTQLYHIASTAPMADFTGIPSAGPAPLSVQFTDASIDATSWSWNFGDGTGSSKQKNPSYKYTTNGKYTVTLVATNKFGSSTAKKVDYITVGSFNPGLTAYYYNDQTWSSLVTTNTVNQIHFADTTSGRASDVSNWPVAYTGGIADHFSAKYDGFIKIDTEDDYTFTLSSDDGSYMDLGGTTDFISNGGDHSFAPVSATRHLVPGYYPVTVRMYENGGEAVVYLQYQTSAMSSPQLVTNVWHM
jgi:PKD repeat protein